jgi:tetratricopeptide (TPR) repeat protein
MDDFNQALTLKPGDIDALLGRARLFFAVGDHAHGQADLDAAAAAPDAAGQRLAIGQLYMNQQEYAAAAAQYDLWLQANPVSAERSSGLKGACDARGMLNQQLDQALADCNAAMKLTPGDPALLISRGLVLLRMGAPDKALADYTAALKVAPGNGWALYGKGVAELRSGQADKGNADIARAAQLTPTLPAEAKRLGLTP